jgi:serine/arginine repetitive matrix protein 2
MAKKKGKKAQKVEWTSPPPSPKAAPEDPVPAIPTSLALERDTKEPTLTESSRDVSEQSLVAPKETGITDISVEQPVQETTPAEDIPAEEPFAPPFPPQTQRKGPALGEEERIESAPKAVQEERTPDDRGQVLEPVPVPEPEQTDEFPTKEEQRTVTADSTPIESNQPITQETELPAPRSILIDEPPLEEQREPIEEEIFEAVVPTEQVQTTFEEPLTKPGPEVEASTEAEPSLLRKKSKKKGEKTTSSWDEPSEDPTKEVSETNSEPTPIAVQIPNSVPSLEETAKEIKNPDLAPEEIVQEVSRPKETAKEIEKPERAPEEIIQEVSRPKETIVDVKDAETNPVHVHFEAPIEAAPVEAPLEAPLEIPVQTHIEVPVKAPIEVPVELAPLEAPVQGPVEVLVKSPAPAPVEPLVQAPVEAPVEAPVDFQALLAAPIPAQTPGPIAAPIPSPIPAYIATLVAAAGGTPSPPSAESISPIPSPVYPEALTRSPPSEAIDQERRPTFNYPQSPPRAVASEREGPPTYTYPQSSLRSGASEREGPPTTSTYPQTHPRSVATERERPSAFTSPESPRSVATDRERSPISSTYPQPPLRSVAAERERAPNPFAYPQPLPKPAAVNHILEDSRLPSAPSPPVTRARPRHTAFHNSALETEDEDDTALTYPRFRGHAPYRDPSRDKTYPPPPQPQPRSVFASRVPVEHYPSQQAPPQPPPSYHHPQYYPPQAPPYYQGPGHMSQPGGYPNHAPYGPQSHDSHTSHSSSPYRETWNHPYGPYGSQSPPHRHEHLGSREYGRLPAIQNGEDDTDVFARISQAIPDLHVLLAKYKETHGQLGVREELLRRADAEQEEKLRIKDQEVHSLQERIAHLESRQSTEAGRLRLEIGNMEEQLKDLKEQLAETARYKQEAGKLRATLDTATKYWESRHKDLDEAHSTLQKISSEATARARKEFEDWRYTATTKHDAEKIALAIQFDKQLREADVRVVKEKNELRAECEQALQREREDMEVWEKERSALVQAHREDIEGLRKSWEEQRLLLEEQADERKRQLDQLLQDKEDVQKQYNQLRSESGKERDVIKSVVGNLESEKARLEKLMESYGDIAEIKSKGDTY